MAFRSLIVVIVAAPLSGCLRPVLQGGGATPASAIAPATPYDPHAASRFGGGDKFEVRVAGEAELSGVYRVAPDGTFDFPYCGRLMVEGLIASDVESKLTHCLKDGRFLRDPQVVVVGTDIGASRKVFVIGKVQKSGPFPFLDNMSIVEAIALAGGFSPYAAENQVYVIRKVSDGHEDQYTVGLQDIGRGRAPNFPLRPGDIVYVPESAF